MKHLNLKLKGLNSNGQVETFKLSNFKGTNLIVYFYPQDDTPICTQEANDFNEKINYDYSGIFLAKRRVFTQ